MGADGNAGLRLLDGLAAQQPQQDLMAPSSPAVANGPHCFNDMSKLLNRSNLKRAR